MGTPNSYDLAGAKAAILGIPFDCGIHPTRIGARLGPSAIREQSSLVRPYQPPIADFNPLERLGVVDCGDVNVTPSLILEAHARIEAAVGRIVAAGAVPVTMGGDGSVTLPQLRALHRKYPDLALLHFDAHTDTYPGAGEGLGKYNPATTFTRAAEEGIVDARNSLHIGARGSIAVQHIFEYTRSFGYELIDGLDLFQRGIPAVLAHLHAKLAGRPVYLCFDMDFFDPSAAPGVCTPTWGGASAREGLALLQGLAGLDIVATDVNTVSPPHDVGGMTAFLAGTVVLECLTLVARARKLTNEPAARL
ncbi:MAG: arginase family protein [Alphaproteobacteria bacterium]